MGLMVSRNIDLNEVFNHELAPIILSMFENSGEMRISKSKSILKRKLLIEPSVFTAATHEVSIFYDRAILWCKQWPIKGICLMKNENMYVHVHLVLNL